jgi:hypothetical protein
MAGSKVKLNLKAFKELRNSDAVVSDLTARAQRIADRADDGVDSSGGPDHVVFAGKGRQRARAAVVTASAEAMLSEATDRNLTRAVDAGR